MNDRFTDVTGRTMQETGSERRPFGAVNTTMDGLTQPDADGGAGTSGEGEQVKESASFLKKRSKKLFLIWSAVVSRVRSREIKSFFASVFPKKEVLAFADFTSLLHPIALGGGDA